MSEESGEREGEGEPEGEAVSLGGRKIKIRSRIVLPGDQLLMVRHYGVLKCYLACENWQPKDQSQGCSKDHEIHSSFPHEANLEGMNSHQLFVLSECGASQGRQSSSYRRYNLPNARVRWLLTLPNALALGICSLFLSFHVGEDLGILAQSILCNRKTDMCDCD